MRLLFTTIAIATSLAGAVGVGAPAEARPYRHHGYHHHYRGHDGYRHHWRARRGHYRHHR